MVTNMRSAKHHGSLLLCVIRFNQIIYQFIYLVNICHTTGAYSVYYISTSEIRKFVYFSIYLHDFISPNDAIMNRLRDFSSKIVARNYSNRLHMK